MGKITYVGTFGEEYTIDIGRDFSINREDNCVDICLKRAVASDCPLSVAILIRTNGEVVFWYSEFDSNTNPYWHFSNGTDEKTTLTEAQRETLSKMHRKAIELPGKLSSALGRPVIEWAFGKAEADFVSAYHN